MDTPKSKSPLAVADICLFSLTVLLSVATGVYFAVKDKAEKNTEEYFFGKHKMSPIPVGLSLAVSFVSGITIMAYPVEVYYYGAVWIWICFAYPLSVLLTIIYIIPIYYNLKMKSIYEYLELRYNKSARLICAFLTILYGLSYAAVVTFIPALALNVLLPISVAMSIALTSLVCTFYTVIGGFKSVIWTDTLQSVIMLVGSVVVCFRVTHSVGGVSEVMAAIDRGNRSNVWVFDLSPFTRITSLSLLLAYSLDWFILLVTNQAEVQRYLSCKSENGAKIALGFSLIPQAAITSLAMFTGCAVYAYFENCDPLSHGDISNNGQLVPYLVSRIASDLPGLTGLFVAAIYAGTLSSISSGINSLSVIIMEDFIPLKWPKLRGRKLLICSKICAACIGVAMMCLSLVMSMIDSTLAQLSSTVLSSFGPPILSMILLGLFVPWTNSKGALTGGVLAFLTIGIMSVGSLLQGGRPQQLPTTVEFCNTTNSTFHEIERTTVASDQHSDSLTIFNLSFLYFRLIALVISMTVAIVVSFATGPNDPAKLNPKYFSPLISNHRFPEKWRRFMRFGVPTQEEFHRQNEKSTKTREMIALVE